MESTLKELVSRQHLTNKLLVAGPIVVILALVAVGASGASRERSLSERLSDLEQFKRIQVDFDETTWQILNDPNSESLQKLRLIKERLESVQPITSR